MTRIGSSIMPDRERMSRREVQQMIADANRMAELKKKLKNGDISKAELVEIGARMALDALSPDRFTRTSQRGNI